MRRTLPALAGLALAVCLSATALAAPYASRTLEQGTSGGDVRILQRLLDRSGHETSVDGAFGPATASSVRAFENDYGRRVDGRATRREQRRVRTVAAGALDPAREGAASDKATIGPDGLAVPPSSAPPEVAAIIEAGNEIATKPYVYGGGHGSFRASGYDCSGSVSYALHGGGLLDTPLDSSGLAAFGRPGKGDWVTVYGNPGHAYMVVAGLRFDTSSGKRTGNRWTNQMRSSSGYTARHPSGL